LQCPQSPLVQVCSVRVRMAYPCAASFFERMPGFGGLFPLVALQTLPGATVNTSRAADGASPVWR
jgi:hypothetical protein